MHVGAGETQPISSVPEIYGTIHTVAEDEEPDPMEPATYKAVCEYFGRNMADEFPPGQFDGEEFTPQELMVRQDFAKMKVRWSDDYEADRTRYLNQTHPFLSILNSHRLHMISRRERLVVYVVQIFMALLVALVFSFASRCGEGKCYTVGHSGVGPGKACVFPFTYKGKTYNECTTNYAIGHATSWCSVETDKDGNHIDGRYGKCWCPSTQGIHEHCWARMGATAADAGTLWTDLDLTYKKVHAVHCCIAHHTGVGWFVQKFGIGLGGTLYAAAFNTAFVIGSFQLMICGCVQRKSPQVRQAGEKVGIVLYTLITIMILLPQPYLMHYAIQHELLLHTFFTFLAGKIASFYSLWVLQSVAFYFIWYFEQHEPLEDDGESLSPKRSQKDSRECVPDMTSFHVTHVEYEAYLRSWRDGKRGHLKGQSSKTHSTTAPEFSQSTMASKSDT
jgi:hypothetical protein